VSRIIDTRSALRDLLNILPNTYSILDRAREKPAPAQFEELYTSEEMDEMHKRAKRFLETYGPLRPAGPAMSSTLGAVVAGLPTVKGPIAWAQSQSSDELRAARMSSLFAMAHMACVPESQDEDARDEETMRITNVFLKDVFDTAWIEGDIQPSALDVDILAGTVTPVPRDLLDHIALELMRSRKQLATCARCSRFFYKEFSKDKYCSLNCSSLARAKAQLDWTRNSRKNRQPKKKSLKKA
jgi:hypothetical protein